MDSKTTPVRPEVTTRQYSLIFPVRQPLVVADGLGVNSMAVLVGFVQRNIRPDLILFADVGAEKDETYAYLPIANYYLRRQDLVLARDEQFEQP